MDGVAASAHPVPAPRRQRGHLWVPRLHSELLVKLLLGQRGMGLKVWKRRKDGTKLEEQHGPNPHIIIQLLPSHISSLMFHLCPAKVRQAPVGGRGSAGARGIHEGLLHRLVFAKCF